MTEFFATSRFPVRRIGHVAEIQLGKMLQPSPGSPADIQVQYMRAGHLSSFPDDGLPTMWASPSDCSRYAVEVDDLVVAEGGDVGRPEFVPDGACGALIQNSLHRVRPRSSCDTRFLRYALLAVYNSDWLDVLCNRSTFGHLTVEKLSALHVPFPSPKHQTEIAAFLDTETARIDALTTKKARVSDLLYEKRERGLERVLDEQGLTLPLLLGTDELRKIALPNDWRIIRLGATLRQLTNGYVGPTRDILQDEGVRYIQGLHLKGGRIDFDRHPYFVASDWHKARPRTSLREGDVLIVQTGDIGRCAIVPDDFGEANCHALLIARPNQDVVSSGYLGAYLQSGFGYRSLLRVATGALHPHLEFGIRDVPIVVPPMALQREIADAVEAQATEVDSVVKRIGLQIALLQEHRQAIITAAVTGELGVPRVAA